MSSPAAGTVKLSTHTILEGTHSLEKKKKDHHKKKANLKIRKASD